MALLNVLIVVAALLTTINGVCIFIDKILQKRDRPKIATSLVRLWDKIDSTRLSEIGNVAMGTLLKRFSNAGLKKTSIVVVLTSIILTTLVALVIPLLRSEFSERPQNIISTFSANNLSALDLFVEGQVEKTSLAFFPLSRHGRVWELGRFSFLLVYLTNLLFDALTIVVTLIALHYAVKSEPLRSLAILIIDAVASFLFAACSGGFLCAFMAWAATPAFSSTRLQLNETDLVIQLVFGETYDMYREGFFHVEGIEEFVTLVAINSLNTAESILSFDTRGIDIEIVCYSLTTFIPTILYLTLVILFIIAKPILPTIKSFTLYLLERMSEGAPESSEFQPFTTLGLVISATGLIISFLIVFTKALVA